MNTQTPEELHEQTKQAFWTSTEGSVWPSEFSVEKFLA